MARRPGTPALARLAALAVAATLAACSSGSPSATGGRARASTTTTAGGGSPGTSSTAPPSPAWLTYGGSFARDSVDGADPAFTHAPQAAWTSPALDGPVYGEPLLYRGQVLVATENDTVYALSAATGAVAWSVHLAAPVPAGMLPCGDITPTVGVTSTMVVDPASGSLFVSAALTSGGAVHHDVYGIDLATHALLWTRDVDQPGWTAAAQLQRAALGLSAGHVIVGFGGNFGDCGAYNGWVVGVPESGTGPLLVYEVPTQREGAIWAPGGVTVDAAGDVFVVTGNGSASAGQPFDHGNAVIELSPALTERQYFAPSDWAQDNEDDGDLGSTSVMALGATQLFTVGKQQTAYLLQAATLGGIGGQVASLAVCPSLGANAYQAPDVYVVCTHQGTIDQVVVGPGNHLARGWTWRSPTGTVGSPTIAGGVLWSVDIGASVLYGVDPATGATEFRLPLDTGTPPHFAAPSAAGGMLVVAGSSRVEAFR